MPELIDFLSPKEKVSFPGLCDRGLPIAQEIQNPVPTGEIQSEKKEKKPRAKKVAVEGAPKKALKIGKNKVI